MKLYTMGFTKKSAERFFGAIREHQIEMLVDIRLNNRSQLAGFTKGDDLAFFLREICACEYSHREDLAPTKEILDGYKKGSYGWDGYVEKFLSLMENRQAAQRFLKDFGTYERVLLLCSEPTPEHCHRRLLAELIKDADPSIEIFHI